MTNTEAARILSNGLVNAPSDHIWATAFKMAIKALEGQRTGKWIDWLGTGNEWECSECKGSIESHGSIAYRFCPMCGTQMEVEHE